MHWRGGLGGLPTPLVVLCAGITRRTLLLLLAPQKWQFGFWSFCILLFIICPNYACVQLLLVPYSFFYLFIYLFRLCWVFVSTRGLSSSCGKRGPLLIAVRGPLTVVASLVAEHKFQTRRLSSCGSRAQLLRGMWDPPRPGLEPVSPAPAGRLSTTAPPGKLPL